MSLILDQTNLNPSLWRIYQWGTEGPAPVFSPLLACPGIIGNGVQLEGRHWGSYFGSTVDIASSSQINWPAGTWQHWTWMQRIETVNVAELDESNIDFVTCMGDFGCYLWCSEVGMPQESVAVYLTLVDDNDVQRWSDEPLETPALLLKVARWNFWRMSVKTASSAGAEDGEMVLQVDDQIQRLDGLDIYSNFTGPGVRGILFGSGSGGQTSPWRFTVSKVQGWMGDSPIIERHGLLSSRVCNGVTPPIGAERIMAPVRVE